MTTMTMTYYAYVREHDVVEHSIDEATVLARGMNPSALVPCTVEERPIVAFDQYLRSHAVYDGHRVWVTWEVHTYTFQQALNAFNHLVEMKRREDGVELDDVRRSFILLQLTFRDELHHYLDQYAREQGYRNAKSLFSYANSAVKKYRDQSQDLIGVRDQLYVAFDRLCSSVYSEKAEPMTSFEKVLAAITR